MKTLIILVSLLFSCTTSTEPLSLKYSVHIPKSVKESITLNKKSGEAFNIDAIQQYKASHFEGWKECIIAYTHGELNLNSTPTIKQQWGFHREAETDGFNQCKKLIFQKEKVYGKAKTKEYLTPISETYIQELTEELNKL